MRLAPRLSVETVVPVSTGVDGRSLTADEENNEENQIETRRENTRVGGGIVAQGQCGTDIAFMTFHEQTLWI